MTPDELIEAAARAASDVRLKCDHIAPHSDMGWQELVDFARAHPDSGAARHMREIRAAASIIIEACAKEADALHSTTRADGNGSAYYGNVSARLRALLDEGKE